MVAPKQEAWKRNIQTFSSHNMFSSIYMRGQNRSNLYFVESSVDTESGDTL